MSTASAKTNANTPATTNINPEQAVAFAALILADDNLAITPEKLQALLKVAGIESIEPIWTTLFANALQNKDVKDILTTVATSGPKAGGDTAQHMHCDGALGDGDAGDDEIDICVGLDSDDEAMFGCSLFD
ncbi:Phosphatidylserine decarboxylase [Ascochyta rabiei]|uniref:Large ribosomal subunit protein P1 n=1 Tax=Didymella rabiei TaxID=5454 RepID=A0A163HEG0_DIDRA|nr:Phosphatidylserine decarboxylase [Ascochyta rabiei]KZM25256.1 structural constituent of ribosome [Ascochyta rabiei]UPX15271.1 Phosphatidylserine decarboxylase [Ascochyta rabiei]